MTTPIIATDRTQNRRSMEATIAAIGAAAAAATAAATADRFFFFDDTEDDSCSETEDPVPSTPVRTPPVVLLPSDARQLPRYLSRLPQEMLFLVCKKLQVWCVIRLIQVRSDQNIPR